MPAPESGAAPPARAMRKNSQAPNAETTASIAASGAPPARIAQTATGAATTAKRMRRVSSLKRGASGGDAAVAPLASLELEDRLEELTPSEIRPQHGRHHQLGVSELPQEKVGDTLLAGGADQQIRIREASGVEPTFDRSLVDLLRPQPTRGHVFGDQPRSPRQLGARAVGDEQIELEPRALRGLRRHSSHRAGRSRAEAFELAEELDADTLALQLVRLAGDVLLEEGHQRRDLGGGTLPVLLREGEEREHAHPCRDRPFDHVPHGLHSG